MRLNRQDKKDLVGFLLSVFTATARLRSVVGDTGRNFEDYTTTGQRRTMYSELVENAADENWLDELLEAIFDWLDTGDNKNRDVLADLWNRIFPPSAPGEPHRHLLTSNMAFVNRDTMRDAVANVANLGNPSVLIIKGETLAGASYCWHLIRHVAREDGAVHTVQLDFDHLIGAQLPEMVMRAIGLKAGFGPLPDRNDLIGTDSQPDPTSPQLVQALAQWFLQQAGSYIAENNKALWLVFDNAHRDRIPPATKELMVMLMNEVGTGQIDRLAMFVLGCDRSPAHSFMVEEIEVFKLGQADVRDFLSSACAAIGGDNPPLGSFANVGEALAEITQGCDFNTADLQKLRQVSLQLTSLMRSL